MVATDCVNSDTLTDQTRDLAIEEQAYGRVPPLAIVYIAGNDDESDLMSNGLVDERGKGIATGRSQAWR